MLDRRRSYVWALAVAALAGPAFGHKTENSTPISDDEDNQECLEMVLECLPWNQRDDLEKLGAENLRVAPPSDLEQDGKQLLGATSPDYGCVTVSSDVFKVPEGQTEPDKWLKKRVFFHEATHVGQATEGGGFAGKIRFCYAGVFGLTGTGQDLMDTLHSYQEVDAGVATLSWLGENEPGEGAPDAGSWSNAAKKEAEYLSENLAALCDGISNMPNDEALDDMKEAFTKCARMGKAALEKYNEGTEGTEDDVAVPDNAAGK